MSALELLDGASPDPLAEHRARLDEAESQRDRAKDAYLAALALRLTADPEAATYADYCRGEQMAEAGLIVALNDLSNARYRLRKAEAPPRELEAGHVLRQGRRAVKAAEATLRAQAELMRAAVAEHGGDAESLRDIDALADRLGKTLQKALAPKLGFALLIFEFGPPPAPNAYRSNADNRCMAAGLRQLADRLDRDR